MADNVPITAGTGTNIATDDDGTAHHQYVKMEWGADNTQTKVASGAAAVPIQDGGNLISVDDGGGSLTVDGTVAVSGTVAVTDNSGSLTVDNSGTFAVQATQSGTWTVQPGNTPNTTAWKVDASSVAVPVTDNSGSLTVDAPVGTPVFVRLSDGSAAISTLATSIADGSAVTVGAKADNRSTATDTTATSLVAILKQLSYQLQATQPAVINKHGAFTGTLSAGIVATVTTAQTMLDGSSFTAVELEITNADGAAELLAIVNPTSKTASTSSAANDTITVTGHGLGTTNAVPVTFTSVSFTSSPTLTTTGTVYYVKGTDADTLKIYTDSAATALVDITSAAGATFYLAPTRTNVANFTTTLPATPSNIVLPSYNAAPVVLLLSAGTPAYRVVLRGA